MEEIRVKITKREGRKYWMAYYFDPLNGKQKFRSTGEVKKREAERWAAKWEAELQEGRYKPSSKITWEEFKDRFRDEHLSGLAPRTNASYEVMFSTVEKYLSPKKLRDLTLTRISKMQSKMREEGKAEDTIANYSRHLKAALRWAVEMGIMPEAPKIRMPKRAKGGTAMKGRPITGEEFDRMLENVKEIVGTKAEDNWKNYLKGLWYSGLRFSESLNLHWDGNEGIIVDLDRKRPMLIIPADSQKSNRDELLLVTPDFAEFLQSIPIEERTGRVFEPVSKTMQRLKCSYRINKLICKIGEKAGIKVSEKNGKVKFASAHDLRRSFGLRWAKKVMPAVLKSMMRHSSIETTMKYYVGQDAESMADAVWGESTLASIFSH